MLDFVVLLILVVLSWYMSSQVATWLIPNTAMGCGNSMFFDNKDVLTVSVPALPGVQ